MSLVKEYPSAAVTANELVDAGYDYHYIAHAIFVEQASLLSLGGVIPERVAEIIALEVLFARIASVQQSISRKYVELRDAIADFETISLAI